MGIKAALEIKGAELMDSIAGYIRLGRIKYNDHTIQSLNSRQKG